MVFGLCPAGSTSNGDDSQNRASSSLGMSVECKLCAVNIHEKRTRSYYVASLFYDLPVSSKFD